MGQTMMLLETLITNFSQAQFDSNKIPPAERLIVMRTVCGRFAEAMLDDIMQSTIAHNQQEQQAGQKEDEENG